MLEREMVHQDFGSVEDAFASLAVCFAIEKSAHTGAPVSVDYWWDRR